MNNSLAQTSVRRCTAAPQYVDNIILIILPYIIIGIVQAIIFYAIAINSSRNKKPPSNNEKFSMRYVVLV